MNDFGVDITGYIGIVKAKHFSLPKDATIKQRAFIIESGPGTSPTVGRRTIRGHWASDNAPDTVSSYDFEWCTKKSGEIVDRLPEYVDDTKPVVVEDEAPGLPSKEELKAKKVRRKR